MNTKNVYMLALKKITANGLVVHPKCRPSEQNNALVILAAFFGEEGCVAISISGLEMLQNSAPGHIDDLLDSRIQTAYDTLRTRVLQRHNEPSFKKSEAA